MSKASVFIIESLTFADEENNKFEGKILSQILHLGEKESKYYYFRTKKELKKLLEMFDDSDYRYLHLSCHGTSTSLRTTLDRITFSQFGNIVEPHLENKRLFISACEAVNYDLAEAVIPTSDCWSIVGPDIEIEYSDAAIMWASFYHLAFKEDPKKMTRGSVKRALRKVVKAFGVPLNYYAKSKKEGIKYLLLKP